MPQNTITPSADIYEQIVELKAAERLPEAEVLIKQVLAKDPNDVKALVYYADLMNRAGAVDQALALISELQQKHPGVPIIYQIMGTSFELKKEYDKARVCFEQGLKTKPDSVGLLNKQGNVLISLRKFQDARKSFEQALKYEAANVDAQAGLAVFYLSTGNFKEAEKWFKRCLGEDNTLSAVNFSAYVIHFISALNWDGAIEAIIALNKGDISLLYPMKREEEVYFAAAVGLAYYTKGEMLNAANVISQLSEDTPSQKLTSGRMMAIYKIYLYRLFYWRQNNPDYFIENMDDVENTLYVLGDSHCLVGQNLRMTLGDEVFVGKSSLVLGVQARHLGLEQSLQAASFNRAIKALPAESTVLMTVGEIDLRSDVGVLPHAMKKGKSAEEVIDAVITSYLTELAALKKKKKARIIIQTPPITIESNASEEIEQQRQKNTKYFSGLLKEKALEKGFEVLDVYPLTCDEAGAPKPDVFLDNYHLKPEMLTKAALLRPSA
jgi:tetratricopeptide (TPR) repeat protein